MSTPRFRVLLIQEDVALAEALARRLSDQGLTVRTAGNEVAAHSLVASEGPPDVVVLDLTPGKEEGHRFRKGQLMDKTLACVPTVVITGEALDLPTLQSLAPAAVLPLQAGLEALHAAIVEAARPTSDEKICGRCGRAYDSLAWQRLRLVGQMDNGRGLGEGLELRNCECGSTLTWEMGRHALSVQLPAARRAKPRP